MAQGLPDTGVSHSHSTGRQEVVVLQGIKRRYTR